MQYFHVFWPRGWNSIDVMWCDVKCVGVEVELYVEVEMGIELEVPLKLGVEVEVEAYVGVEVEVK